MAAGPEDAAGVVGRCAASGGGGGYACEQCAARTQLELRHMCKSQRRRR